MPEYVFVRWSRTEYTALEPTFICAQIWKCSQTTHWWDCDTNLLIKLSSITLFLIFLRKIIILLTMRRHSSRLTSSSVCKPLESVILVHSSPECKRWFGKLVMDSAHVNFLDYCRLSLLGRIHCSLCGCSTWRPEPATASFFLVVIFGELS